MLMDQSGFQKAVEQALKGKSQVEVARAAGIAASTISTWLSGGGADPHKVFAVERALDVPPGHLSRHLGYIPVTEATEPVVDVRYAIENDPYLVDPLDRRAVLLVYNVFRERRA